MTFVGATRNLCVDPKTGFLSLENIFLAFLKKMSSLMKILLFSLDFSHFKYFHLNDSPEAILSLRDLNCPLKTLTLMFADGLTEEEILGLLLSLKLSQSDFNFWTGGHYSMNARFSPQDILKVVQQAFLKSSEGDPSALLPFCDLKRNCIFEIRSICQWRGLSKV